jgi:membrane protein
MLITKERIKRLPIVKSLISFLKSITFDLFNGLSLYDLVKLYFVGVFKGAVTQRASAISFSFFMALFPFALFLLNLIPYIPIENFQSDFLEFVEQSVPPTTYEAVEAILKDIMNTSYKSLLSTGFLLSVFLMSNGVNALLDGFEMSSNISIKRGYFRQYSIAIGLSIIIASLLLITVAAIFIAEVVIQKIKLQEYISDNISIIQMARYIFVILMVLMATSFLYKFGTRETRKVSFISYGSVFTTILFLVTSYAFGIYVQKFAKYNELYGSIGTLLVMMFYIWINCTLILLGFELNALIYKLKQKNV